MITLARQCAVLVALGLIMVGGGTAFAGPHERVATTLHGNQVPVASSRADRAARPNAMRVRRLRLAQSRVNRTFRQSTNRPPRPTPPKRTNSRTPSDKRRINRFVPRGTIGVGVRFEIDRGRISRPKKKRRKPKKKHTTSTKRKIKRQARKRIKSTRPRPPRAITAGPPPLPLPGSAAAETDAQRRPDQVIVLADTPGALAALANAQGLQVLAARPSLLLAAQLGLLRIPDGRSVPAVVAAIAASGGATAVAANHVYGLQQDRYAEVQYSAKLVRLTEIGDRANGKGVRIGIIDTAIEPKHPSLNGVQVETFDAMPKQKIVQRRHGTAIAGLIGGREVVTGPAPMAQLLLARAFDGPTPKATTSDAYAIVSALDWMAERKAQIVNLSFAGAPNLLLREALVAAQQRGMILVAAAGNGGPRARPAYPAAYPTTVAVTATNAEREIYVSANRGDYVFVAAPGVDLLVPTPGGNYDVVSGTSFAAAIVSGLAALRLQRGRSDPEQIAKELGRSAVDLGPAGRDRIFGHGLVDAARLITR